MNATAQEVDEARGQLESARGELAACRTEVERLAMNGASDADLEAALTARDEAALRVERGEVRVAALEGRLAAEESATARSAHLVEVEALISRVVGWRAEFLQAGEDADRAMQDLSEALERRACCAREVMATAPKELRELERLLQPVWNLRAAAHAGLAPYLALQHPWTADKLGPLAEDRDQAAMRDVAAVLAKLRAEIEGEAA